MRSAGHGEALQIPRSAAVQRTQSLVIQGDPLTYVVHESIGFLIPESRNRVSAFVVLVCLEIDFVQMLATEKLVYSRIWILVVILGKLPPWPTILVAFGIGFRDTDVDNVLETLQVAYNVCSVSKGTEESNVHVITIFLGLEWAIV